MKHADFAAALLLAACATAPGSAQPATASCPPAGYDRAQLDTLKAANWAIPDGAARNGFARALTACLGDPDPSLRDGIAFEALQYFMRNRQLSGETQWALLADLEARLAAPEGPGFERPFAALVLSEVARTDRIEAYFTPEQRARLLDVSLAYFTNVRDYRGFDQAEGWRHGVAHGSDLLMQLALNEGYGREDLLRIRDAAALQIAPAGHFYVYGEHERLARPILVIAQRGVFTEAEWSAWFAQVAAPAPLASWNEAFSSQAGLARKHNTAAFVQTIWINARLSENAGVQALLPGADAALRALP